MDGRVLDAPWPVRWFIVNCCILPSRPKQSAEAYHKVWTEEGSPLIAIGRKVKTLLQQQLQLPVELAMRYQNPSIAGAISSLRSRNVRDLLLIPLFPHYAMSSFETAAERAHGSAAIEPRPKVQNRSSPLYNDPDYISGPLSKAPRPTRERRSIDSLSVFTAA